MVNSVSSVVYASYDPEDENVVTRLRAVAGPLPETLGGTAREDLSGLFSSIGNVPVTYNNVTRQFIVDDVTGVDAELTFSGIRDAIASGSGEIVFNGDFKTSSGGRFLGDLSGDVSGNLSGTATSAQLAGSATSALSATEATLVRNVRFNGVSYNLSSDQDVTVTAGTAVVDFTSVSSALFSATDPISINDKNINNVGTLQGSSGRFTNDVSSASVSGTSIRGGTVSATTSFSGPAAIITNFTGTNLSATGTLNVTGNTTLASVTATTGRFINDVSTVLVMGDTVSGTNFNSEGNITSQVGTIQGPNVSSTNISGINITGATVSATTSFSGPVATITNFTGTNVRGATVSATTSFSGPAAIITNFTGTNLSATGTLNVTGNTSITGTLNTTGNITTTAVVQGGTLNSTGNITATGTVNGADGRFTTSVSSAAVSGNTARFNTNVSSASITGTTLAGTTGNITTVNATTVAATTGAFTSEVSTALVKGNTVSGTNFNSEGNITSQVGTIQGPIVSSTNATAITFNATTGNITTVNATTVTGTNVTGTNVEGTTSVKGGTVSALTSFSGPAATITNFTATNATATSFTGTTVNAGTLTATGNASVTGTLNVTGDTILAAVTGTTGRFTSNVSSLSITGTTLAGTTGNITTVNATTVTGTNVTGTNVRATTQFSGASLTIAGNSNLAAVTATTGKFTSEVSTALVMGDTVSGTNIASLGNITSQVGTIQGPNVSSTNASAITLNATTGNITSVNATNVTGANVTATNFTGTNVRATSQFSGASLTVTGNSNLAAVTATDKISGSGTLEVVGDSTLKGDLFLTDGAKQIVNQGNLSNIGIATFGNDVTLSGSGKTFKVGTNTTSGSTVLLGYFSALIVSDGTQPINTATPGIQFNSTAGTIRSAGNLSLQTIDDGGFINIGTQAITKNIFIGDYSKTTIDLRASGDITLSSKGNIILDASTGASVSGKTLKFTTISGTTISATTYLNLPGGGGGDSNATSIQGVPVTDPISTYHKRVLTYVSGPTESLEWEAKIQQAEATGSPGSLVGDSENTQLAVATSGGGSFIVSGMPDGTFLVASGGTVVPAYLPSYMLRYFGTNGTGSWGSPISNPAEVLNAEGQFLYYDATNQRYTNTGNLKVVGNNNLTATNVSATTVSATNITATTYTGLPTSFDATSIVGLTVNPTLGVGNPGDIFYWDGDTNQFSMIGSGVLLAGAYVTSATSALNAQQAPNGLNVTGSVQITSDLTVSGKISSQKYPTYIYTATGISVAANKLMFDMFNGTGSGKTLKVTRIVAYVRNTTTITGINQVLECYRTSSVGTGGTAITAGKMVTTDPDLDANITARNTPTGGAAYYIPSGVLAAANIYTEEGQNLQERVFLYVYDSFAGLEECLTLQEGEGLRIITGAQGAAGVIAIYAYFITV